MKTWIVVAIPRDSKDHFCGRDPQLQVSLDPLCSFVNTRICPVELVSMKITDFYFYFFYANFTTWFAHTFHCYCNTFYFYNFYILPRCQKFVLLLINLISNSLLYYGNFPPGDGCARVSPCCSGTPSQHIHSCYFYLSHSSTHSPYSSSSSFLLLTPPPSILPIYTFHKFILKIITRLLYRAIHLCGLVKE